MTADDIYTIAVDGSYNSGDGGPAVQAGVARESVATYPAGNVLVADGNGRSSWLTHTASA